MGACSRPGRCAHPVPGGAGGSATRRDAQVSRSSQHLLSDRGVGIQHPVCAHPAGDHQHEAVAGKEVWAGHDVSDQALPSPRPWALSILHSVGSISSNRTNRSNNLRLHSQAALTLRRQSDTACLQWGHLARVPPWAVTKDQPSKKTSRKKLLATL